MSAVRAAARIVFAAALVTAAPGVGATELRVLAAGATRIAIEELAPLHAQRSGAKVETVFDTVGAIRDRALAGEKADIVLLSAAALKTLDEKAKLAPGSIRIIGRTGVGLAGTKVGPAIDLSTPEAVRTALLAASSVGYADPARGPTAGIHFHGVLQKLGIAEQLAARIVLRPTGIDVVDEVAAGRIALGASQATEITAHPGARLVGLLPDSLQLWTEYGVAVLAPGSPEAAAFVAALLAPEGEAAFRRTGFQR